MIAGEGGRGIGNKFLQCQEKIIHNCGLKGKQIVDNIKQKSTVF